MFPAASPPARLLVVMVFQVCDHALELQVSLNVQPEYNMPRGMKFRS
jgi:hypothetical protein